MTAPAIGVCQYATFRNDVLGFWGRNFGVTDQAAYYTIDMSDISDPLFLAELVHHIDPDNSSVGSSQGELFDGLHTQMLLGDVDDDVSQSPGLSIVSYL